MEFDNYPTPQDLTDAIVGRMAKEIGDPTLSHMLIEPSAGSGRFVRSMRNQWPQSGIIAVEIRLEEMQNLHDAGANYVFAGSDWETWIAVATFQTPVLCIGNPPFSLAQKHLEAGFKYLPTSSIIAVLLRFSFFGGKERNRTFWMKDGQRFLKNVIPIAPRPSFKKGTSDNSEYAVYIFQKDYSGPITILEPILWEKKRQMEVSNGRTKVLAVLPQGSK